MIAVHPFLDHPKPIALAHRGGDRGAENTMSAFGAAVDLGYGYIETDVRATCDGVVVTFHDDDLSRVSAAVGRISQMTWAEVSKVRVGGEHPIPRLDEVLTTWPDVRFNIDVKHGAAVDPLVRLFTGAHSPERVCLGSFSRRRLSTIRNALGDAPCYAFDPFDVAFKWLRSRVRSRPKPSRLRGAVVQAPPRCAGMPVIDRALLTYCANAGIDVHAWTINTEEEMTRLIQLGVGGLITDQIALLKDVLQRNGLWLA